MRTGYGRPVSGRGTIPGRRVRGVPEVARGRSPAHSLLKRRVKASSRRRMASITELAKRFQQLSLEVVCRDGRQLAKLGLRFHPCEGSLAIGCAVVSPKSEIRQYNPEAAELW